MVDLLQEQRISLTQLAREEGVSIPTAWRWAKRGVRGVVLETFAIGGRRYTTNEARRRFSEACTAVAKGASINVRLRTPSQRESAIRRAELELEHSGVK